MCDRIQSIKQQLVEPLLMELSGESERNILFQIIDVAEPSNIVTGEVECSEARNDATVEVRYSRRRTGLPTRFRLQALTQDLAPETGFSGFIVSGRITGMGTVEVLSRTNTYNVREWESKLAIV